MKKIGLCGIVLIVLLSVAIIFSCKQDVDPPPYVPYAEEVSDFTFELVNEVFPYGQDTTTIIIKAPALIKAATIDKDTFEVSTINTAPAPLLINGSNVVYQGSRKVIDAYVAESVGLDQGTTLDANGVGLSGIVAPKAETTGSYIVIQLEFGQIPGEAATDATSGVPGAGTMVYTNSRNVLLNLDYSIAQKKPFAYASGYQVSEGTYTKSAQKRSNEVIAGEINPLVNKYAPGETGSGDAIVRYQVYKPSLPSDNSKIPLVVWLHGSGERQSGYGIENQSLLRANEEGVAWVRPENQSTYGPYWVLVPQAPQAGWSDAAQINVKTIINGLVATAVNQIDITRVYVLGDSMGGAGMWNILTKYPDFFAAAVGAPAATNISDAQVELLKDVPIWILNIATDSHTGSEASYNKMKAAGGNTRWTHYDVVTDLPFNNYGQPHWVWIPTLRNYPKVGGGGTAGIYNAGPAGKEPTAGTSLWDWMFAQKNAAAEANAPVAFKLVNQVFPYGQDTTHIIIDMGPRGGVDAASVAATDFAVHTVNTPPEGAPEAIQAVDVDRTVTGAYVSHTGVWDNATNTAPARLNSGIGQYIVLTLEYGQTATGETATNGDPVYAGVPGASTMAYSGSNYLFDLGYTVSLAADGALTLGTGTSISALETVKGGEINPLVDLYVAGRKDGADGAYLDYQLFTPSGATGRKLPIVVWLHGAGEGRNAGPAEDQGKNLLRANEEGVAWVRTENQTARGPYYVLLPQSPGMGWNATSLAIVKSILDDLLAQGRIDEDRIYLAGDSMGGFGTLAAITLYPNVFASAVVAPGYYLNMSDWTQTLNPALAQTIKHIPIWFTNIDDDFAPMLGDYNTLKQVGGNVRWTHYNDVRDLVNENWGQRHWVWIPVLNNVPTTSDKFIVERNPVDDMNQSLHDWIFAQRRQQTATASFTLVNQVFSYGQDTTHVIIDLGEGNTVDPRYIDNATYSVSTRNTLPGPVNGNTVSYEGPREINRIYVSNSGTWDNAAPAALSPGNAGRYVVIELKYGQVASGRTDANGYPIFEAVPGASTHAYVRIENTTGTYTYLLDLGYSVKQEKGFVLSNGNSLTPTTVYTKSTVTGTNEVVAGEINPLVNQFVAGKVTAGGDYLDYQLYSPSGAAPTGGFPLVVWLHGSGERRTLVEGAIQNQTHIRANEEGTAWIKAQAANSDYKAYVLVPQSDNASWRNLTNASAPSTTLIDDLVAKVQSDNTGKINSKRIYIAGDSNGGRGTWTAIRANPTLFAAAIMAPSGDAYDAGTVSTSGGVVVDDAAAIQTSLMPLKTLPIWILNIGADSNPGSAATYNYLKSQGFNIRYTHYDTVTQLANSNWGQAHWVWIPTLENVPRVGDAHMVEDVVVTRNSGTWANNNTYYTINAYSYGSTYAVGLGDTVGDSIMTWLFKQARP
ncbi:MAG: prolyl oligopeptidase family serine peptidase [Treponema sp.]|jgi:predicted peptidase|nr:prolyl oligopeptidase family serine peptidase [Treponema sp.]